MNRIDEFLGGFFFLATAILLLYRIVAGGSRQSATRYANWWYRWGQWQRQNKWMFVVCLTPLLIAGLYMMSIGIMLSIQRSPQGPLYIAAGIVLAITGAPAVFMPKKLAEATSESNAHVAERIRMHPMLVTTIEIVSFAFAALIGVLMIVGALQ